MILAPSVFCAGYIYHDFKAARIIFDQASDDALVNAQKAYATIQNINSNNAEQALCIQLSILKGNVKLLSIYKDSSPKASEFITKIEASGILEEESTCLSEKTNQDRKLSSLRERLKSTVNDE